MLGLRKIFFLIQKKKILNTSVRCAAMRNVLPLNIIKKRLKKQIDCHVLEAIFVEQSSRESIKRLKQ